MSGGIWVPILAIVASLLSAGGLISQYIGWKRRRDELKHERNKKRDEIRTKAESDARIAAAEAEKAKAEVQRADVTAKVELAKVAVDAQRSEREDTGRFQTLLVDRVAALEKRDREKDEEIAALKKAHGERVTEHRECVDKYNKLEKAHRDLHHEHETLKRDHAKLKEHVGRVEKYNRELRQRLDGRPTPVSGTPVIESETIQAGARDARRTVKQGDKK